MAERTRVLVVEDHPIGRKLLVGQLDAAGYDVLTAGDGVEALAVLEDEGDAIDVVLLDRRMPRMDGMEVLRRLKADPRLSGVPVVMQTAADGRDEIIEGIRAGAFYYLTKPFDPQVLLSITAAAVEDHVHLRRLRRELDRRGKGLGLMVSADFRYRTIDEANDLAVTLAQACPEPGKRVMGLAELLINAVEHGNLGITYDEKHDLLARRAWNEEVARRLAAPEHRHKEVSVAFRRHAARIEITITDQGAGFDWSRYLELDPARAFDNHGRGIALARRVSFDSVRYRGRGNEVVATIELAPAQEDDLERRYGLRVWRHVEPRGGNGGDRVGIAPLDDDRLALWVMDVAGHGRTAEAEADQLVTALERLGFDDQSPASTLARAAAEFRRMLPTGHYATGVLAVVDQHSGRVRYSAAASPPPMVVTPQGEARIGEGAGLPLGIGASATYEDREMVLAEGETLVLHTDGIQSCGRDRGEPLRREGAIAVLSRAAAADDPRAALSEALRPYARPLEDDVTVLMCRRRGG